MNDIRLVGSQRKAMENIAGQYAYKFFLAALADLYEDCPNPDDFPFSEEKGYEVFNHLLANDPPKKVKRPITIMRDAKSLLGALFASIVSVVNETGKVPASQIKAHLANVEASRLKQVLFMIYTAEALWPNIHARRLERDFDSVSRFRAKLEALVSNKANVNLGADELAQIFVRFLKCVVWFTANFAVEAKVTLNGKHLRSVFRCFGGLPNVVFDNDMSEFFDNQLAWIKENDTVRPAKAAAPKATAAKAASEVESTLNGFWSPDNYFSDLPALVFDEGVLDPAPPAKVASKAKSALNSNHYPNLVGEVVEAVEAVLDPAPLAKVASKAKSDLDSIHYPNLIGEVD